MVLLVLCLTVVIVWCSWCTVNGVVQVVFDGSGACMVFNVVFRVTESMTSVLYLTVSVGIWCCQ